MKISFSTTAEFDDSLNLVKERLSDAANWHLLLPGLERLGRYWCYEGELYDVQHKRDGNALHWDVRSASGAGQVQIALSLYDARITTNADLRVTLSVPLTFAAFTSRNTVKERMARICQTALQRCRMLCSPPTGADLAARYPRTVAAFQAMGALDHLERVLRLDATWDGIRVSGNREQGRGNKEQESEFEERTTDNGQRTTDNGQTPIYTQSQIPNPKSQIDYDLIYAGGGLGLLHAAVMAQRYGYRIMLFDRGEVGCAHREWNISREELQALVDVGLCTWDELRDIVMAEYENGVVRFYNNAGRPTELWMRHVLDVALDAGALLQLARRKLEASGGVVLDQRSFRRVVVSESGPARVAVEVARDNGELECHTARLLLDGMGSGSPLALRRFQGQPFAGVCPTVGTVVTGLVEGHAPDENTPHLGDILISVADAQRGQQYMWEGFPGRGDELTVYLFYYDTLTKNQELRTKNHRVVNPGSQFSVLSSPNLMQLFEDYFALLPTYKRPGPDFRHIKPVYGYIPARHSVRRQEAPLLRGVLPVGDSAAQQSPLTFCGFGSHARNLDRTTSLLHEALRHNLTEPQHLQHISPYQVNVSLNWVFSRFMQPWAAPDDVNELQNVFLSVLNEYGEDFSRRFFRDRMRWSDYHRMTTGTLWRYPKILSIAWSVLGPVGVRQWIGDYLVYSGAALAAQVGRLVGAHGRSVIATLADRLNPALGLFLRACFAEWRAMGWN
jgi:lycopene cyclase CruA